MSRYISVSIRNTGLEDRNYINIEVKPGAKSSEIKVNVKQLATFDNMTIAPYVGFSKDPLDYSYPDPDSYYKYGVQHTRAHGFSSKADIAVGIVGTTGKLTAGTYIVSSGSKILDKANKDNAIITLCSGDLVQNVIDKINSTATFSGVMAEYITICEDNFIIQLRAINTGKDYKIDFLDPISLESAYDKLFATVAVNRALPINSRVSIIEIKHTQEPEEWDEKIIEKRIIESSTNRIYLDLEEKIAIDLLRVNNSDSDYQYITVESGEQVLKKSVHQELEESPSNHEYESPFENFAANQEENVKLASQEPDVNLSENNLHAQETDENMVKWLGDSLS